MKKFLIFMLISFCVSAAFMSQVSAAKWTYSPLKSVSVSIRGRTANLEASPVLIKKTNTILVPLSTVEQLGYEYTKNGRKIDVASGKISFTVGSASAVVNGRAFSLPCPVFCIKGIDYIPLKWTARVLGFQFTRQGNLICVSAAGQTQVTFDNMVSLVAAKYKNVSVTYLNPDTGETYSFGSKDVYLSQSTVKAIYCAYLAHEGVDTTEQIRLSTLAKESSSGILVSKNTGKLYTVGKLIEYTLRYSDNQAYWMLVNHFGRSGYNLFVKNDVGLENPTLYGSALFTHITSQEMAKAMQYIYLHQDEQSYTLSCLMEAVDQSEIPSGTELPVAHKYGYSSTCYHDAAIVYDDVPYILTIYSNETSDRTMFAEITKAVQKFHDRCTN